MDDTKPKLNEAKLTPDQRDKLDKWKNDVKQLQTLEDIATMAQEMLGIMDDQNKDTGRKTLIIDHVTGDDFVKILTNMNTSLEEFRNRKDPELPDYSKPVADAIQKLEKAYTASLKTTIPKPEINVAAPNVTVKPTPIDLSRMEQILKTDVPKAFQQAIDSIPTVDIPEADNSPVLDKLTEAIDWLQSIDTASRMKPKPGSIKVTNPDGTSISSTLVSDVVKSGVIIANGDTVVTPVTSGMAGWTMSYYGTYATGASLTMEASFDNQTSYSAVRMLQGSSGVLGYVVTIAAVSNSSSYFMADIPTGATHLRVRCSAWAAPTGVINIKIGQSPERFAAPVATQSVVVSSITTVTPGVTATSLGKAEDAVAATGDTGVGMLVTQQTTPADLANDGDYAFPQMKNGLLFTDGSKVTQPVSIAGTVVVDDLAAAATGSAVPANAQYQGNLAQTALPTAATPGNLTGTLGDKYGRTVVIPGTIRDLVGSQTTTISASTSETTVVTAAGSIFNDLTAIIISNTSATAARVDFRDTTAGSVLFSFYVPAGDTRGATYSRPLPQTSVNTNWTAQSSASITDLRVYCVYDRNK